MNKTTLFTLPLALLTTISIAASAQPLEPALAIFERGHALVALPADAGVLDSVDCGGREGTQRVELPEARRFTIVAPRATQLGTARTARVHCELLYTGEVRPARGELIVTVGRGGRAASRAAVRRSVDPAVAFEGRHPELRWARLRRVRDERALAAARAAIVAHPEELLTAPLFEEELDSITVARAAGSDVDVVFSRARPSQGSTWLAGPVPIVRALRGGEVRARGPFVEPGRVGLIESPAATFAILGLVITRVR